MGLSIAEKINLIVKRKGLQVVSISEKLGISRQSVHSKLKLGKWTEEELSMYADAIGCDVEITFIDRATGERL